jgi:hypothetical protein
MDAQRLIKSTRHALTEARSVPPALIEAWQACILVEAVATVAALALAERDLLDGGGSGAAEIARALTEAAGHAVVRGPSHTDGGGPSRADRLSAVGDLVGTVRELRALIHETAEALIVLACGAQEQDLYWRCIDSVDAVAECQELATDLLRAVDPARREARAVWERQPVDCGGES